MCWVLSRQGELQGWGTASPTWLGLSKGFFGGLFSCGKKLGQFAACFPYGEPDGWRGGSWINRQISQARRAAAAAPAGQECPSLGTLTLATTEPPARPGCHSTLPGATMQLNYSFHGNQWRKSNKSSSLQTRRAFQKPWHGQAGACTHEWQLGAGTGTHLSATRHSC